ncbi:MAG TPA: nitroreductase/quinone reductase family protein [Solirubrobacteraceae bacterium]|jgi:hypothetical protein|nr:nitroreductase/quinone reductase family protein [Solirubrobacteraceae bacterium]
MSSVRTDLASTGSSPSATSVNHRIARPLQKSVVNPLVRLAFRLGIPDPGDALLQTTGRRSGQPRQTPVCDGMDGDTFWLLSEHGRDADWVKDIEANPGVRVKVRSWDAQRVASWHGAPR